MKEQWQNAVAQKDIQSIQTLLIERYIPDDVVTPIVSKTGKQFSLIQILFSHPDFQDSYSHTVEMDQSGQVLDHLEIADQLLAAGAPLPSPNKARIHFSTTGEYFDYLVSGLIQEAYIALRANPTMVQELDDDLNSLLHHAAHVATDLISNSCNMGLIHHLLFNSPLVDFNQKNKEGNTPVHEAALSCIYTELAFSTFDHYVEKAASRGFDFNNQFNNDGQAVIHIAASTRDDQQQTYNVKHLLEAAKKGGATINVNLLSLSGQSALSYALKAGYFDEARSLLAAGANPSLGFGSDRTPQTSCSIANQLIQSHEALVLCIQDYMSDTTSVTGKNDLKNKYKAVYSEECKDQDEEEIDGYLNELLALPQKCLAIENAYIADFKSLKKTMDEVDYAVLSIAVPVGAASSLSSVEPVVASAADVELIPLTKSVKIK